jgi:hypothetical protein
MSAKPSVSVTDGADLKAASVDFLHNTDLDPSKNYLETLPLVRAALRHPALLCEFGRYNSLADSKQATVRLLGTVSLFCGGVALVGITIELLLAARTIQPPWYTTVLFEIGAAASIILALRSKTRTQWLTARFMTERMRQWHFQMLLDGALISKARSAPTVFEAERAKRWEQFMLQAPDAQGGMNSFVDAETHELHHPVEPYSNSATANEAMRAYVDLRFQKQLSYFNLKREEFKSRDEWSEALARWMIFIALLLTAGQFCLTAASYWNGPLDPVPESLLVPVRESLFTAAIVLVVLSAMVRVYRSAIALAPQRERYETKWVRLVGLRAAFDAATTVDKKLEVMREVEIVEIEELREFLRQMRRSSYLL